MNQLNAVIKAIHTEEHISLVVVQAAGIAFHALLLDNPASAEYLQEGNPVVLVFKESAVSIAKNATGQLSIRNRIPCTVANLQIGNVLSTVLLNCKGHTFSSVVTTNAIKELNLQTGDQVEALIKTTDISLMPSLI